MAGLRHACRGPPSRIDGDDLLRFGPGGVAGEAIERTAGNAAETWRKHVGTIIVNRELATSIKRVTERELAEAEPTSLAIAG
jgi:hypothetical protein